jgi:hypothetical protein
MKRKLQLRLNYRFSKKALLLLAMLVTFVAFGTKSIVYKFEKAESSSSQEQIYAKLISDIGDVKNK